LGVSLGAAPGPSLYESPLQGGGGRLMLPGTPDYLNGDLSPSGAGWLLFPASRSRLRGICRAGFEGRFEGTPLGGERQSRPVEAPASGGAKKPRCRKVEKWGSF